MRVLVAEVLWDVMHVCCWFDTLSKVSLLSLFLQLALSVVGRGARCVGEFETLAQGLKGLLPSQGLRVAFVCAHHGAHRQWPGVHEVDL